MTLLLLACWPATVYDSGETLWDDTAPVLEIIGDYVGSDDAVVVVTSETVRWDARTDTILEFSNSSDWLTTEVDPSSGVAGTFARYDWRSEAGQWWICRSADGVETPQDAAAADRPADDDCGGEAWTALTLAL